MSEKDFKGKAVPNPMKRHSAGSNPAPMKRSEKPSQTATSNLLDSITSEGALTQEQKQPLSAREKPKPSEAVFPRPQSAGKPSQTNYTGLSASVRTAEAKPMPRHTVTENDRGDKTAFRSKYTNVENIAANPDERDATKSKSAAVVKMPIDKKPIILSAVAIFVALVIILGCVLGILSGGGKHPGMPDLAENWNDPPKIVTTTPTIGTDKPISNDSAILGDTYASDNESVFEYAGNSLVGYSSDVIREMDVTEIVKPVEEATNEGLETGYPSYGANFGSVLGSSDEQKAKRAALIRESNYLIASTNTTNPAPNASAYNMMDAQGKLWFVNSATKTPSTDTAGDQRTLYKHSTADSMYRGKVSDSEPRIVKEVTMRPRGYNGYGVTGLYAPAGEVIKIEIDNKDMNATGGLTIHIGQALYNGQANNIWVDKNQMQRFPIILNTMVINKNTATYDEETGKWTGYVGSFLGGPLYIRNTNSKFTATISGCVRYSHFILGYTTEAEFQENAKSSAPYFDLEVWDRGVLHSGPKVYAANRTYEELYKVAVLWEKVASVTTYKSNQGIVFIYDPFVAAGAAVAFPGRRSVNCPESWMRDSLNYNGIVTSGSWGNFHEYHHNFQGYGVGNGGEVTNNGLTLVSYALFTKISAKRGIGNFGAQGLGGWNDYTSATWALEDVLKISRGGSPSNGKQGLALYATLLHNFGADAYMNAKVAGGGQSYAAYMNAWQNVTHNNMYYYFDEILEGTGISDNADPSYPTFVPISCVYQTGRSYMYDGEKRYFETMRPYVIPAGQPFNIDLNRYSAPGGQYAGGSIVMPEGFVYRIKSVSQPSNGKIKIVDNYNLKYTPDPDNPNLESGKIVVTLQIVKNDEAFKVDDVDLVLEFEQSFETNKMTLERSTYTYTADNMYDDAETAYENGFRHYINKNLNWDHKNPTQNCNTDIWFYPDTEENRNKYPDAPESYFVHENTIEVIDSKIHFSETGKYRIYLRGRSNCAVYYSIGDNNHFTKGAAIKTLYTDSAKFHPNDANTYFDLEFTDENIGEDGIWVYLKEILIVQTKPAVSYIGLGMNEWTQTMFTIAERYYTANGTEIDSPENENYDRTETTYNDPSGAAVAVVVAKKNGETEYFKIINNRREPSTEQEVSAMTESKLVAPTAYPSYLNAYRNNYHYPDNSSFESDYFYVRSYNYNYADNKILGDEPHAVADQCNVYLSTNWGGTDLSVLTDGITNSGGKLQLHSNAKPTAARPFTLTIDLGKVCTANRLILYSQAGRPDPLFPKALNLYASMDGENYTLIQSYTNLTFSNDRQTLNFNETELRYYKVEITDSLNSYVIVRELEMWHTFELAGNGSNHVAPDNPNLRYDGNWETVHIQSSYGYAYLGQNGSTVTFEMIGTRLAVLTSNQYTQNYEVFIDGVLCPSIDVKEASGEYSVNYLSQKLNSGKHKVEIRCKGAVCFDSFAVYNEG